MIDCFPKFLRTFVRFFHNHNPLADGMEQTFRVLFVTSEITPFLKVTSAANSIRLLPQLLQERGHDVRIFMPKFGIINERRNRLHEVVRLSGINIRVAGEEKPLTIKVASVPNAKLQVYFLDNEDYFKRRALLNDPKTDEFFDDNDERAIFFCKGVIETVRKLGWSPNVIHCHGWMAAYLPLYLRTVLRDDPVFKNAKIVYTAYNAGFEGNFVPQYMDKVKSDGISIDLDAFYPNNYVGISKGAMSLSDAVTKGHAAIHPELESYLQSLPKEAPYIDAENQDAFVQAYDSLFGELLS